MPDIKSDDISITGLADLERQLLGLSDKLAKNVMFGAMRAGAVVLQKAARAKCPVSAEAHWLGKKSGHRVLIQPGELKKKGIRVKRLKQGESKYKIAVAVYASKRYWYARFVEYGHVIALKARNRKQKREDTGHIGYVQPRPFMRPAWDESKDAMLEAARNYLAERIPRELANGK